MARHGVHERVSVSQGTVGDIVKICASKRLETSTTVVAVAVSVCGSCSPGHARTVCERRVSVAFIVATRGHLERHEAKRLADRRADCTVKC